MNNAFGQTIQDEDLLLSKTNSCSWAGNEIVAWDASAGECTDFPCSFPTGNGNHMPGQTCSASGTNRAYTQCTGAWVVVDCIDWSDGGNQGGGQGGSPNTGTDPSDNDNTNPLPDPEIPITPLEPTQVQDIIDCLVDFQIGGNNNSQELNLALNSLSPENQAQIHSYLLLQNTCSDQAKAFIEPAIEALDNDGVDDGVVDFEEQIINELSDKALCVYNKLKSSSTGFKNAIKKFEPEFPVAHLKFDMGNIGTSRGRTIAPNSNTTTPNSPNYVITVRLNNNDTSSGVTERPNLLIAKTIAHEVIHAEMYRKLLSILDSGVSFDGVTRQDVLDALSTGNFPGMYDYFRRHKNWQHQQMATHYRESLARILQEYDTGAAVPNSQQPSQLYMDLSWEGLRYPSIYTWSSLPQSEKDRIDDVISDYVSDNLNQTCTE